MRWPCRRAWGAGSRAALVLAQRALGLAADGVWGPATTAAVGMLRIVRTSRGAQWAVTQHYERLAERMASCHVDGRP